MTSAAKTILVLVLALPVLLYLGSEVGSDDYALPLGVTMGAVISLLIALFFRGQRLESLVLSFLMTGYLVGNRGFAQLYIIQPLFVGEVGLALIIGMMGIRFILTREFLIPDHPLSWLVGGFLFVAFARSYFDVLAYGIDAVRDLAIVYYALFFFLAYQLGRRENEVRFLDRSLRWAFISLTLVSIVYVVKPDWLDVIQVRGVPLLIQKGDLTATFSVVGIFFLSLHPDAIRSKLLRRCIILVLLVCVALIVTRAALIALLCAYIIPWTARIRSFRVYIYLMVLVAAIGLLTISLLPSDNPISTVQDQVISMVDISGSYNYQTEFGDQKSADNNFRRYLWQSFFNQTVQSNQWVLGKGFGYDFVPQFETEYQAGHWEGLRSAHSYYVTIFGRLGAVGSLLLLGITLFVVRSGLQAAVAYRRGELESIRVLVYWCGAWAILASGTFGVVMEGPMGAIPFWSFLGLALGADPRIRSRSERVQTVEEPVPVGPAWKEPVPVPFKTVS